MFRMQSKALDKIQCGEESLMDRIAYMFTSDKSISEKIGDMLYAMSKMDEDEKKALESTHIDFKMQTYSNVQKLMAFSGAAVDFVVSNVKRYEGKSYALLENERDEIRQEIDSACSSFNSSHDRNAINKILDDKALVDDKTYAVLGFHFDNLYSLTKEFKDSQSGRLSRMKKMKFISEVVAVTPENFQLKVVHQASKSFAKLLDQAIDCYKYVDRFLFYTYRKLEKQGIINKD